MAKTNGSLTFMDVTEIAAAIRNVVQGDVQVRVRPFDAVDTQLTLERPGVLSWSINYGGTGAPSTITDLVNMLRERAPTEFLSESQGPVPDVVQGDAAEATAPTTAPDIASQ